MKAVLLLLFAGMCAAQNHFIGSRACAECHAAEFAKQSVSHHALALKPFAESRVADLLPQPEPKLEWAFGAGAQGITPVGKVGEQFFENRLSYYTRAKAWGLTFGHPARASTPLAKMGVLQSDATIKKCFSCHSTTDDNGTRQLGVQCERCHGGGGPHATAARASQRQEDIVAAIGNPAGLKPLAQVQFCGQCHRLPALDAGDEPELNDPITVRFAPIGLLASRCFRESGALSCITCHDPHENAQPRSTNVYTERCMSCHAKTTTKIRLCKRATRQNCLSCHMRQTSLGPYLRFTDHRIRVMAAQ